MDKITKNSIIKEILVNFPKKAPEIAQILSNSGVACVGCCAAAWESLEEGLKSHGKTDEEIKKIVGEINKLLSKNS